MNIFNASLRSDAQNHSLLKGDFLYELSVLIPFLVRFLRYIVINFLIHPTTCGFLGVGGGGGRICSC